MDYHHEIMVYHCEIRGVWKKPFVLDYRQADWTSIQEELELEAREETSVTSK